jgi:hypothetical protein
VRDVFCVCDDTKSIRAQGALLQTPIALCGAGAARRFGIAASSKRAAGSARPTKFPTVGITVRLAHPPSGAPVNVVKPHDVVFAEIAA